MCCFKSGRKEAGIPVQIVRMDNDGENVKLKERCDGAQWKLNINFEFTARDTPQQNRYVEVGLLTIANRGRSMMIAANIPYALRYKFVREAFTASSHHDGLVIVK